MAYNLQPLITILQEILNPQQTLWILDRNKSQLQSLLHKATSLQKILENSSLPNIEVLESQIRDAAYEAEDIIEYHMVFQMLSRPGSVRFSFITPDLRQVTKELDYLEKQVVKMSRESSSIGASFFQGWFWALCAGWFWALCQMSDRTGPSENKDAKKYLGSSGDPQCLSSTSTSYSSSKSSLVGIDEELNKLKGRLIGMHTKHTKLEIIPIVGMGGIGKTTLAQKLYEDPLIVSNFKYCGWATISQDCNVNDICSSLLGSKKEDKLADWDTLYRRLSDIRYMIVLDDIWSIRPWDEIKTYFPENNNGSRIVITTRESEVAKYVGSHSQQHQVQLLSDSDSWNLLRQIAFGEEDCPPALQDIGRKIASDCGGLPLAINVIGGLLSTVERSEDVWGNISNDVSAAIAESDEDFSKRLSLSYNHLPNHLKSCFLYMGAFPKSKASKLISLWIAEGFVKPNGDRSLEEEAENYLKALVERNLFLVGEKKLNEKPKRYIIHDLLRDLCMRKADEEKFIHVKNDDEETNCRLRRVIVPKTQWIGSENASTELMPLVRSYLTRRLMLDTYCLSPIFFELRLLRVLDVYKILFEEFPTEMLQLVNLRYLAFSCEDSLPTRISRLRNLQTLIAGFNSGYVPSEVWDMSELRHLKLELPISINAKNIAKIVQKKLQKLQTVSVSLSSSSLWSRFFETIPNIKDLEICSEASPSRSIVIDLHRHRKLEKLTCKLGSTEYRPFFLRQFRLPSTLGKLFLIKCAISPEFLTTLSALPNLRVLKIHGCVFGSKDAIQKWEAAEEDVFGSLRFLSLAVLDLVHWKADETNFPRLEHLAMAFCSELKEIPSGIGDITTLQSIKLQNCSYSAAVSAMQIEEVQKSEYGNNDFQLSLW